MFYFLEAVIFKALVSKNYGGRDSNEEGATAILSRGPRSSRFGTYLSRPTKQRK